MIHWLWIPITVVLTVVVIIVYCCCVAGGQADERLEQGAVIDSLRAENRALKAQLEEITALQLKLAAEKVRGDWK